MTNEEEITPSAPRRREVELGKGVVILPPERIKAERKEEPMPERRDEFSPKPIERREAVKKMPQQQISLAPNFQNLILIGLAIIAVVSIVLSIIAMTSVASMKSELKGVVSDLKAFSKSELSVRTKFEGQLSVDSSVPIKDVIAPFSLPIPPHELSGIGNLTVILPGYSFPITIPWNGTLTVSGSATVDTSQLAPDRKMVLSFILPGTTEAVMKIQAEDLFKGYLENVTNRLEKLSR